jgi:hypothetical protein
MQKNFFFLSLYKTCMNYYPDLDPDRADLKSRIWIWTKIFRIRNTDLAILFFFISLILNYLYSTKS